MKKKVKSFIIGAGGLAREVYNLLQLAHPKSDNFGGFIAEENGRISGLTKNELIVSSMDAFIEEIKTLDQVNVYPGIGTPNILYKAVEPLLDTEKVSFPNLIHPNLTVHKESFSLGKGNVITSHCSFTVNCSLGNFNYFNLNSTLGHDSKVGSFNIINPGSNISGGVNIGNMNLIGTNATVLQNIKIGNNNTIGAASLLTKTIDNDGVFVGVPAKLIKKNSVTYRELEAL